MPVAVAVPAFLAGALVSLATSWVLVSRIERVWERLGLSEAMLGIVAALAADAPEVTAAVTAIAGHEQRLGAGVVIGSNVFNLAALLGPGAVVAGRVRLHRKVVLLGGTVAMCVAIVCLVVVLGILPPLAGLALVLVTVALYALVLSAGDGRLLARLRLPWPWITWLRSAVAEEEAELEEAIRPARARRQDAVTAALALLVVVVASVTMERAASALGTRFAIPEIVVGGLVLAAVTSLPNAVAAVYLAARGRAAATLSTALNSNTLNVALGLLLPAAVIGLGGPTGQATLIAAWYAGLTAVMLAFAYRDRGVRRSIGILVIAAYIAFAGSLLVPAHAPDWGQIVVAAGTVAAVVFGGLLVSGRDRGSRDPGPGPGYSSPPDGGTLDQVRVRSAEVSGNGRWPASCHARVPDSSRPRLEADSLLPGCPVKRFWYLGVEVSFAVAVIDAVLGHRVILIGLLIIGPCCVLLTGRWVLTGLAGLWVTGLAVALGLPDGIWGTSTHLVFMAAVAAVALIGTLAAAVIEVRRPPVRPH
ncbi:MAG: sodium:calcium antiporter [Streptosporangiaceae bacterium]